MSVLISNGSIEKRWGVAEFCDENGDRLVTNNLKGNYIVTQTVLPDMVTSGWNRIVNVSALGG